MRSRIIISSIACAATLLPSAAAAEPFRPGDDVLVRVNGLLTRAWIVAPAAGDRFIVGLTWDSRKLKVLANSAIKRSHGPKLPPSRKVIKGWTGFEPGLYRIAVSSSGGLLAAAVHRGGALHVFRQDVMLHVKDIAHVGRVDGLAITGDGKHIAVCDAAGTLSVYRVTTGKRVRAKQVGAGCRLLTAGPSGVLAFEVRGPNMALRLYDLHSDTLSPRQIPIRAKRQRRSALRFAPDGTRLLDARDTDKRFRGKRGVRVYDVRALVLKRRHILTGSEDVASLAISGDGKRAAAGGRGRGIRTWSLDTGRLEWSRQLSKVRSPRVDLSVDGASLAVCSRSVPGKVVVLDARTGRHRADLSHNTPACTGLRFAHGDRLVYTSTSLRSNFGQLAVYRHRVAAK